MPRIAPVILGAAVGALFTLAVVLVIVTNPFDGGTSGRASAAAIVPITAHAGLAPPQAGSVPALVNFQGILTDSGGGPISDGARSVTFSIHDAGAGGTQLWSESQSVATTSGLFTVLLGSSTAFPTDLFDDSLRYLEVQVESDPPLSPRQQFTSVPYAVHAATASRLSPSATPAPPQLREDQISLVGRMFWAPGAGNYSLLGGDIMAVDPADYPIGTQFSFETVTLGSAAACARLYNLTTDVPVVASELCHAQHSESLRLRSGPFSLAIGENEYGIHVKCIEPVSCQVNGVSMRIIAEWTE